MMRLKVAANTVKALIPTPKCSAALMDINTTVLYGSSQREPKVFGNREAVNRLPCLGKGRIFNESKVCKELSTRAEATEVKAVLNITLGLTQKFIFSRKLFLGCFTIM